MSCESSPSTQDLRDALLEGLLLMTPEAILSTDRHQRILSFNPGAEAIFGYRAHEILGESLERLIPQRFREFHREHVRRFGAGGKQSRPMGERSEILGLRKSGEEFPAQASISYIPHNGGMYTVILRDVSEQRRTQAALAQAEHFARDAIRSIAEGISNLTGEPFFRELVQRLSRELRVDYAFIAELDRETQKSVRTVAACVRGTFGPTFDYSLPGTPCEGLLSEDCCVYPAGIRRYFPGDGLLARLQVEAYLGVPLRAQDGRVVGILVAMHSQPLEETEIAVSTLRIFASRAAAELERLRSEAALQESEAQLRQIQKMEAIGRLAGGIAHDFNNLLAVINGYSELALQRTDLPSGLPELLGDIRAAGDRAAILTRQLLSFSRRQVGQPVLVDLNESVTHLERILRRLIGEDIELRIQPAAEPAPVWADAGQLAQVVMNLVVNARDAMPLGGLIEVSVEFCETPPPDAPPSRSSPPGWARLTVRDTGCGIDTETQGRIFEPFFTTKREGEGTGLGLAIVYGIVQRAGGTIELESEVGKGTTFRVLLPLGVRDDCVLPEKQRAEPATGSETVLVLEDEELLRNLIRDVLQSAGYRVLLAESAEKALRVCAEETGPVHLLVTDVVMPGMNGREAAEHLAALRPGIRVLFISGYAEDEVLRYGISLRDALFLPKPFTPAQLTRTIREILDNGPR